MDSAGLRTVLLYSTIINYAILIVWFLALMVARCSNGMSCSVERQAFVDPDARVEGAEQRQ